MAIFGMATAGRLSIESLRATDPFVDITDHPRCRSDLFLVIIIMRHEHDTAGGRTRGPGRMKQVVSHARTYREPRMLVADRILRYAAIVAASVIAGTIAARRRSTPTSPGPEPDTRRRRPPRVERRSRPGSIAR